MKYIIADNHFLSRIGLEHIIQTHFKNSQYLISPKPGFKSLSQQIKVFSPNIVLLDYISMSINHNDLEKLMIKYPDIKFILITEWMPKDVLLKYFHLGVKWHLLKECDEQEITECIEYAQNNQSFFCNKIIQFIQTKENEINFNARRNINCNGISITQREREIIQLIAEGFSNKQIADKLNISIHTALTHRKNIMKKINANNTAGVVLFALKNNIITYSNRFLFAQNG